MKKSIAFLLSLLLMVSMTACGSKEASSQPAENAEAAAPVAAPETEAAILETVPETAPETEAPTVPTEPAPAFDITWARNPYEALLPELPMGNSWYRTQDTPSRYTIDIHYTSQDTLETYIAQLEGYGFHVEPVPDSKYPSYKAADAAGHTFSLGYHGGAESIGITIYADIPTPIAKPIDTSWASNHFEQQIPQPPVSITNTEWLYGEYVDRIWRMDAYDPSLLGITGEHFDAYTRALYDCGFTSAVYYERHNDSRGFHAINADTGFYVEVYSNEDGTNAIFTIKVTDLNTDLGDHYPRALSGSEWDTR